MKKGIILFVLSCMTIIPTLSQRDITGIYAFHSGFKVISIVGDQLMLTVPDSPGIPGLDLANCSIKWVSNQFIELNSLSPNLRLYKGLKVTQSTDTTVIGSIKITFTIPHRHSNLEITVFTDNFKMCDLIYSEHNKQLIIPSTTKSIQFFISPSYFGFSEVDGSYHGILSIGSIEYPIEKSTNRIDIEIPAIDDSFFEKYYVKGEYAKVSGDTITWKGEAFIKQ